MAHYIYDYINHFYSIWLLFWLDPPQSDFLIKGPNMRIFAIILLCLLNRTLQADTVGHYMEISSNIPRMEMKADPESQAWARSARNVILLTGESIWESLKAANEINTSAGKPLFCISNPNQINAEAMTDLIQSTYEQLQMNEQQKFGLTVAQLGLMALQQKYPCREINKQSNVPSVTINTRSPSTIAQMLHIGSAAASMP